jgi:hypothetical protein
MTKATPIPFALCGALALLATGCMQKPKCEELGNCGGVTPLGSWVLSPGHPSCSEQIYVAQTDTRLARADLPPARTPPPEPALYDWCDLLVTSGGNDIQAKAGGFVYSDGQVGSATVRFNADGTFSAGITKTGTYTLDFPALCMREFGAKDKLSDPTNPNSPVINVCKQLEVPLRASGLGEGAYPNTTCDRNPNDPNGCLCYFDVTSTGGPAGYYQMLDKNTILFLPGTNFPQKATYCNKGDTLELTGTDGEYLFDVGGLRTFNLSRVVVNCTDGMQGAGEDGIDCGPSCPTTVCPTPPAPPAVP